MIRSFIFSEGKLAGRDLELEALRIVRGDELQERIAKGTAVEIVGQKKAADGAESSQGNDRSQLPSGNKK